jgi:DNA-binding transcriptional regulator YhcF (GntR family)
MRSLTVDPRSPIPPFEQIRSQIADLVGSGSLRPGDRLPPVRQLAADLGLAVGTVNRAYRELEAEGLVVTRRRTGTHIAQAATPRNAAESAQLLDKAARAYVSAALAQGAKPADVISAVIKAVEAVEAVEAVRQAEGGAVPAEGTPAA